MLSVKKVERLSKKGRYYDGGNGGVRGLCLQIGKGGAKSWLLRFQLHGKKRWMGLGSARDVPLAVARGKARAARLRLSGDIDPLEGRQADRAKRAQEQAQGIPFREAGRESWEADNPSWSNRRHTDQFINTLRDYAFPIIGNLDVAAIDTPDVLRVCEQRLEASRGNPGGSFWNVRTQTASRTRNRIERVLDYAVVRGHR